MKHRPVGLRQGRAIAGDDEKVAVGVERARALCAKPGDVVVVTAGISKEAGSTNLIRVLTV